MRNVILAAMVFVAGCGGSDGGAMIGKTVIVSPSDEGRKQHDGFVLAVNPVRDPNDMSFFPKSLPSFRAVVVDEIPVIETSEGPYPARWIVKPDETECRGMTIGVWKKDVVITPVK